MELKLLLTLALVTITVHKTSSTPTNVCTSPTCASESARLKAQIDSTINPCDDFFQFACGNFLKSQNADEIIDPIFEYKNKAQKDIEALYNEPIAKSEHFVVQYEKKTFQACMDTDAIEEDNLATFKEVLKQLGGWPLVEGSDWDESKFDWIQTTYKLRELGYNFQQFFVFYLDPYPKHESPVLRMTTQHSFSSILNRGGKEREIKNIAVALGANAAEINEEVNEILAYELKLLQDGGGYTEDFIFPKVADLETHLGNKINWLEFINTITAPGLKFSPADNILLKNPPKTSNRLDTVLQTPKRLQANYMLWKMIESAIPFLNFDMRKIGMEKEEREKSRSTFCLETVQKLFSPSAVSIMYARTTLPKNNWILIDDLVRKLKDEFANGIDKITWMSNIDKNIAKAKAFNLAVIIGELGDYFEDSIFDNLHLDMKPINEENFLNLASQATRNYISRMFQSVKKNKLDSKYNNWYMLPSSHYLFYDTKENIIRLPTSQLNNHVFDESKPNYLNYGKLGKTIGEQISQLLTLSASLTNEYGEDSSWSDVSDTGLHTLIKCLDNQLKAHRRMYFDITTILIQAAAVGSKLSHEVYKKWSDANGEEAQLPNLNYTPRQLFWISGVVCIPEKYEKLFKLSTYAATMNSAEFSKDFNCPANAPMNPLEKCETF